MSGYYLKGILFKEGKLAKEAILQVRMDANMKEAAERVYKNLGTSLPEAVRVFASQSIQENGYPFRPRQISPATGRMQGRLAIYADALKRGRE